MYQVSLRLASRPLNTPSRGSRDEATHPLLSHDGIPRREGSTVSGVERCRARAAEAACFHLMQHQIPTQPACWIKIRFFASATLGLSRRTVLRRHARGHRRWLTSIARSGCCIYRQQTLRRVPMPQKRVSDDVCHVRRIHVIYIRSADTPRSLERRACDTGAHVMLGSSNVGPEKAASHAFNTILGL